MTAHDHRLGDVVEVLAGEPDNSFDALLCDPPYGLSFMGKDWDAEVPGVDVWREVYRVLKPGAFGLVFGGTRTFDVLGVSLRRAGFERRDCFCWLYGSGFPKSTAIGKAIDKAAGAEREMVGEPIRHAGQSYQWADENRHPTHTEEKAALTAPATPEAATWEGYGTALKPAFEPILLIRKPPEPVTRAELYALTGWNYWVVVTSKSKGLPRNHRLETLRYRPLAPGLCEVRFYFLFVKRGETEEMTYLGSRSEADGSNWFTLCEQANALKWGTGALNIDGGRIGLGGEAQPTGGGSGGVLFPRGDGNGGNETPPAGRWPANAVFSHTSECRLRGVKRVKGGEAVRERSGGKTFGGKTDKPPLENLTYADADGLETVEDWECSPDCPVRLLDEQSGELSSHNATGISAADYSGPQTWGFKAAWRPGIGDTGGASRFFYCAKASPAERNAGCEGLEERQRDESRKEGNPGGDNPRNRGVKPVRNHHPTVKPVDLCRWLAKLLLPPERETPRRLLVPFAGSGSEMIGAHLAGWDEVVGIELNPEYVEIQRRRCAWWAEHGAEGLDPAVVLAEGQARDEEKAAGQLELLEVDE